MTPPGEPDRPDEAQGAEHYISYLANINITTAMQGPTVVGDAPEANLGLGLITFNADWLDFHDLNKLLCGLQHGQAVGIYVVDTRCSG